MIRRLSILLALILGCCLPYGSATFSLSAQTYGTHYSPAASSHTSSQMGINLAPEGMQAFRSTSALPLSGSALPMAAATGPTIAISPTGPLRDVFDGYGTVDDVNNPNQPGNPVGDIPWLVMAVLMIGYIVRKKVRKNRLEE